MDIKHFQVKKNLTHLFENYLYFFDKKMYDCSRHEKLRLQSLRL